MASVTIFVLFFIFLSAFLTGCSAIKCRVCAPVAELDEFCATSDDGSLEDCPQTVNSCHVLFIHQANGQPEITRNCGAFKGFVQAGDNECKDFVLAGGRSAKLCNCQVDGCNQQTLHPDEVQTTVASAPIPSGSTRPTDANKVPIYNPPPSVDTGSTVPPKAAARNLNAGLALTIWMVAVTCSRTLVRFL